VWVRREVADLHRRSTRRDPTLEPVIRVDPDRVKDPSARAAHPINGGHRGPDDAMGDGDSFVGCLAIRVMNHDD
jgi:hypothetical protein